MGMRQILLGMVLLFGSVNVFAEANQQRDAPPYSGSAHQRAERASFDSRSEPRENAASHSDAERRSGRLSPDERRELRRQINEAGHDIYRPRH
jgi:hypothetical protein